MRLIAICLTVLLMLIQYPLWLGKGGWLRVWDMDQQVVAAHEKIDELKARNAKLGSEVQDLKEGTGAVEERARSELGMIKQDEIFVQVLDPNNTEVVSTLKEAQQLSDSVGAAVAVKPVTKPGEKTIATTSAAKPGKAGAKPVSNQTHNTPPAKLVDQQVRD